MAHDVWVTAGAPLQSGDGWRIWYSWPDGEFTPATPRVRTTAGASMTVIAGPWEPKPAPGGSRRRMGVREIRLANATPGARYDVTIPETGGTALRWRTLPSALPDDGVSVLISSCFWLNDDRDGFYAAAVKELVKREGPVFKLLMGDQLYVDVWAPNPLEGRRGLAAKYERYWGDRAYREMLAACPTLVTCDDHEFWNDYPQAQIQVPLSWPPTGTANATALAELYDAYQAALNPGGRRSYTLDLPPVSFFVADTRSRRTKSDAPAPALMAEEQLQALEHWARDLQGPGVLVLPQPLLKAGGSKTDRTLLDFHRQSDRIGAVFARALGAPDPHDILILTGDIHTGRLSSAEIVGATGQIHELVASPASRVTPWLPPWGPKPSTLPDKLTINARKWTVTSARRLTATVDNNVGLVRIGPGRNGRQRFTLQLWRVRPYVGPIKALSRRPKPPKGAQPLHDPIEIELR